MNIYLSNLWNQLRASFWPLPALMALAAFGFSFLTLSWDKSFDGYDPSGLSMWQGGAEGARLLLSSIASSVITITGVVFSLTIVALSLTSTQFGSRILRHFVQDLGTQIVLGTFISTSIYALLILRTIRHEPSVFIPNMSISISLGLAILSLGMLIFFIHHLSTRVQAANVVARIAGDFIKMIESSMLDRDMQKEPESIKHENKCTEAIVSSKIGYLQAVDYERLIAMARKNQFVIEITIRPGHFLSKETILAKTSVINLTDKIKKSIAKAFIIGKERSPTQDIEYMIDQLVTIALRALSLNSNDTFTCNACIDHLAAALSLICHKEILPPFYRRSAFVRLGIRQQTFMGLVDASFNQIRQHALSNPAVLIRLLEALTSILPCAETEDQKVALKKHALMVKEAGERLLEKRDREDIYERFHEFNLKLEA